MRYMLRRHPGIMAGASAGIFPWRGKKEIYIYNIYNIYLYMYVKLM